MRAIYTALLIGLMLLVAQAAQANTLIQNYSDLNSWLNDVNVTNDETFDGAAAGQYNTSNGFVDLGIDFVGGFIPASTYSLQITSSYGCVNGNCLVSGYNFTSQPYIQANLPSGVTAIALNLMSYGTIVPITVTTSDGSTFSVPTSAGTQSFLGLTFSAPITSLQVTAPSGYVFALIDNFRFGTACTQQDAVPEPRTLLLIGLGLVLLASLRRYRRPDTM